MSEALNITEEEINNFKSFMDEYSFLLIGMNAWKRTKVQWFF